MIVLGKEIYADEGNVLIRKEDNLVLGEKATLGYTYMIRGKVLDERHLEVPDDYTEIEASELDNRIEIYGMYWPVEEDADFAVLKDMLVKVKYSIEDQMSIMCNISLHPEDATYKKRYNEMQDWRQLADRTAKDWIRSHTETEGNNE